MARIPLWVDLRHVPRHKRLPYLKAAAETGADALLFERGDEHLAREGPMTVAVAADGALRSRGKRLGRLLHVASPEDQAKAARAKGLVVVHAKSWRVIPLENLVAARRDRPGTLYAHAASPEEATLFAATLDVGVDGVVLAPATPQDIARTRAALEQRAKPAAPKTPPAASSTIPPPMGRLQGARVTAVREGGVGDRVCIDTTSRLHDGEGLLVGSTARGFALVHAETLASGFLPPRPFRVNAGALHQYVLAPEGRTRYLSELRAGDPVLVASAKGTWRTVTLGRAKLERRPHTLVEWDGGMAVLQTAETVRLVRPDGTPVAVTDLKPGDEILVHAESAARHAGLPVDANLEER
jgi:3-dehydroquinate synthase II